MFDQTIFDRVIAEDDEAAARPEEVEGGGQAGLQGLEFLVDRDPERLEDAGRRMGPSSKARVGRGDALDQRGEFLGRRDRGDPSRVDDRAGDSGRLRFLAVASEQGGQFGRVERFEQV